MLFHEMFEQMPKNKKHLQDPSGNMKNIRDFNHVLQLLNHIIGISPSWTDSGHSVGVVGVPIDALLEWPMATPAGFTAFQDPKVNEALKKVLDAWGVYLKSPESADVFHEGKEGWFGPEAKKSLATTANVGVTDLPFEELFECDPSKPHYGFNSWDAWVRGLLSPPF
jgi:phosphatidylserine decarboxylase